MTMDDLEGKGNISLPPRLQSPNVDPEHPDDGQPVVTIVNMQRTVYDVLISDGEKHIERYDAE